MKTTAVKPAYTIFAPKKPRPGFLKVRIKFTDSGDMYDVLLVEPDTAKDAMEKHENFLAVPGFILIDEATLERAKQILDDLVSSGYFDSFVPVKG